MCIDGLDLDILLHVEFSTHSSFMNELYFFLIHYLILLYNYDLKYTPCIGI